MARGYVLIQRLRGTLLELALAQEIAKLAKFEHFILADIAHVGQGPIESSALFELIAARYECQSIVIAVKQPFGQWDDIFPDQAMTVAAIDKLVHNARLSETNDETRRRL